MEEQRQIYIVISQTGTILSRIIKAVTGAVYNHASISVDPTLQTMYSFGRMHPYNPVWGGFVKESPAYGTFHRFQNTKIVVLALPVGEQVYQDIKRYLEEMYDHRAQYTYNYIGLFLALFHLAYRSRDHYYCSEFVRHVLAEFDMIGQGEITGVVHPTNFMQLPEWRVVYQGSLQDFACESLIG